MISGYGVVANKSFLSLQTPLVGSFPSSLWNTKVRLNTPKRAPSFPSIKCKNTDGIKSKITDDDDDDDDSEDDSDDEPKTISVERHPYHTYMDSISGQPEPASGARASIPGQDYWPAGTISRVRTTGSQSSDTSSGTPSYGKAPGSRRKWYKNSGANVDSTETSASTDQGVQDEVLALDDMSDGAKEDSDFVVYQTEPSVEELTEYERDKEIGRPHPFIDPTKKRTIEEPLTSEELWWNWRKPDKKLWSRWQNRRPDAETAFILAMVETGQIKLYGDYPTATETSLYRARKETYKEERLQDESERLEKIGPLAYYSEWVKAWKRDTSREAVQKHFEETGENEFTQLLEMFSYQTDREYRIMRGTDVRCPRDPLAMRMREDQIRKIWGGDLVYPTVNYFKDPDEWWDHRSPESSVPYASVENTLKENGIMISRMQMEEIMEKENVEETELPDTDDAMANAIDIGETEDATADGDIDDEKVSRYWSVLKSNPELRMSKGKGKEKEKEKPKKGKMSLQEAIDDSENLTDFLLDFGDEDD